MPKTIRLLSTHLGNRPQTILTLADAVADALLSGGVNATLDLTGGVPAVAPVVPNTRIGVDAEFDAQGVLIGLRGRNGAPIPVGAATPTFTPMYSQYDKALVYAPPPRQINAVKGMVNNNDLQYCMVQGALAANTITDADVYDSMPGWLSIGRNYAGGVPTNSTGKALAFPHDKVAWDLALGQSLLIQAYCMTIGATGNQTLFGNSTTSVEGFGVVLNSTGTISFNHKGAGTTAKSITISRLTFDGTSVVTRPIPTDTPFFLQIVIDGQTRAIDAWIDGEAANINQGSTGNGFGGSATLLNEGSTLVSPPRNLGFGYIPTDTSFTPVNVKAMALKAFRMAVLPAGKRFQDPDMLALRFCRDIYTAFKDTDYTRD